MVDSGGLENRWSEGFRGFESLTFRQEQSRSNADKMQYILINGLAGFIAKWQPKPLTYENNYNVRENGKFVRAQ